VKYGDSLLKQLFGMWNWLSPGKHVLDGDAPWRHIANMIEPSMWCDGAAFFCHITLTTCYVTCVICSVQMVILMQLWSLDFLQDEISLDNLCLAIRMSHFS